MLLCLLPILFLLVTTLLRPLCLNSSVSLPLSAALLALIRLAYLSSPPLLVLAHVVVGSLEGEWLAGCVCLSRVFVDSVCVCV